MFVARPRDFDRAQLARRQLHLLGEEPERWAYVASAEDTVLAKLEWYRLGGETSDRQWRDVLGVLKVQGQRLDRAYMRQMALELGVRDLLESAFEESVCVGPALQPDWSSNAPGKMVEIRHVLKPGECYAEPIRPNGPGR